MTDVLKNQIIASFQNMGEVYTTIESQKTENDLIFSIEIPVKKLKSTAIRIIISKNILENKDPEAIKTKLNELIEIKINSSRELFGEFRKIEKGHCAWVLKN